MKKISILIALALIVTIGGVYATWTYSEQDTVNHSHEHFRLNMVDYEDTSNSKGHITCIRNTVDLAIDESTETESKAVLLLTGDLLFIFSTYDNAADTVKANGIDMQFSFSTSEGSNMVYNETPIFKFSQPAYVRTFASSQIEKITNANATDSKWGQDLSAYISDATTSHFALLITNAELKEMITINEFSLPTVQSYHDFQEALGSGQIGITVDEYIAP